nr:glycosyltransferase family 39 protein [uncultured Methanomethylovorans sp.]
MIYNLNFRNISSGDNIPASLIPFAILDSGTPYLDNFIPCFEMGYKTTYFLLNSHNHFISFFPIVTPVLITPLYVIPYLALKYYGEGFSIYDPHLYLVIALMEKMSASIIVSLACIFIFLAVKRMFNEKIAWVSTIVFGLATNTWSTSSQGLWQHGMVELLLSIMIYLVLLIEEKENVKKTILLGLLSGLFIFNRPPDSVFLIPIIIYVLFLKKKSRAYYCLSLLLFSLPFALYNMYMLGGFFGGYDRNVEFLTVGISTLINILGLLFSPNRGLFVYSPILILSSFGIYRVSVIENKNIRIFISLLSLPLLLNFLTYASFSTQWWGGYCYGPRFLTGMLPIIIIYQAIFLHYAETKFSLGMKRTVRSIFCVLFIVSLFVQIIGAFYYPNGYWDAEPNIDENSERLWKWNDNQIMTTYNAGPLELYFLDPTKGLKKDIATNAILISGWEGLEPGAIPTRWMINNGTIDTYFMQARNSTINFTVLPFDDLKDLQVKLNGNLANEVNVNGLTTISLETSFREGRNQIVFYSPQGCKSPIDIPELNSKDPRCLSFAFQNITIEGADVTVLDFKN